MESVRVSKEAMKEALLKYLEDDLAMKIFWEACDIDERDARDMVGMTYAEWNARFDDDREVVWADDTNAGFGRRGDSVYGNLDDCVICRVDYDGRRYKLWVWCEPLKSESRYVMAAMAAHAARQQKKVTA